MHRQGHRIGSSFSASRYDVDGAERIRTTKSHAHEAAHGNVELARDVLLSAGLLRVQAIVRSAAHAEVRGVA